MTPPPKSAREALFFESVGVFSKAIEQLDAVVARQDAARVALTETGKALAARVTLLERRLVDTAAAVQDKAVQHVARQTNELARNTFATHKAAFEEAGRELFRTEVEQTLQRLLVSMQRLSTRLEQAEARDTPWPRYVAHAMTAAVTSAITWAFALYVFSR